MDEHRLGLKPILRKRWARKGVRPVARVHHRYEWLYLWAFVNPQTGETVWYIMPTVSTVAYQQVLENFAKSRGQAHVLLLQDQAGWHTSAELRAPANVDLINLPPYSPELQPAERLWRLTDEGLANRSFADLDELEACLDERCTFLLTQFDLISRETLYHWWPLL